MQITDMPDNDNNYNLFLVVILEYLATQDLDYTDKFSLVNKYVWN